MTIAFTRFASMGELFITRVLSAAWTQKDSYCNETVIYFFCDVLVGTVPLKTYNNVQVKVKKWKWKQNKTELVLYCHYHFYFFIFYFIKI